MEYTVTVVHLVVADTPSEALTKAAKFGADLHYAKVQQISRAPEVRYVDVKVQEVKSVNENGTMNLGPELV